MSMAQQGKIGGGYVDSSGADVVEIGCDAEFWERLPFLTHTRDYAWSCGVSPWSVYGVELVRAACAIPPEYVLPREGFGSYGSLNMFLALTGFSGDGKGNSTSAGSDLVPFVGDYATIAIPPSGEGIGSVFSHMERETGENGRPTGPAFNQLDHIRALLDYDEISTLTGAASRQGSTLNATLCSTWSGKKFGGWNKSPDKRVDVPAHAYRLCLIAGAQPSTAGYFLDSKNMGVVQRFLTYPVTDPELPEQRRPVTAKPIPKNHFPQGYTWDEYSMYYRDNTASYECKPLALPEEASREMWAQRVAVNHHKRGDPMDSHRLMLTARVAAVMQIMHDGALTVTPNMWRIASYAVKRSCGFRNEYIAEYRKLKSHDYAERQEDYDRAADMMEPRHVKEAETDILEKLRNWDDGKGRYRRDMQQCVKKRLRDVFGTAWENLIRDGRIIEIKATDAEGKEQPTGRYYITPDTH